MEIQLRAQMQEHAAEPDRGAVHQHELARHRHWPLLPQRLMDLEGLAAAVVAGLDAVGDAAHAMSPAGGVGINLAIQDAVAAANILAVPLCAGLVTDSILPRVQQRREFPTRVTQFLQVNAHKALNAAFKTDGPIQAPWQLKVVDALPGRKWAMGDHFTLADCAACPSLFYADKVLPFGGTHKHVTAYFDRLKARPSYARVLAEAEPYLKLFPT